MSNHLHDMLEAESKGETVIDPTATIALEVDIEISKQTQRHAVDAMCFYAGDFVQVGHLSSYPELSRLPFSNCWIEFSGLRAGAETFIGALCWIGDSGVYQAQVWSRIENKRWKYWFQYELSESGALINAHGANLEKSFFGHVVHTVNAFLSALNCTNINRIEHKPSEKLQKARVKRGKKPLFSYWTLEIDLLKSRAAGEDYGGTHASPRLHLRRGHPRQYAPGKYCWVQPHVVGNKSAGMVHKDYAAKYAHA